ncbi:TetR/AcrR family transcriptional regulator [Desertibaculum subflavum]|uniref:TetR/AcrR family transcriptional regulator n=1 Tax=Desertibaculum subflavum TaxID=2268458 RepID=UPI000E672FFB
METTGQRRILEAGLRLFRAGGPESVTLPEVAAEAGLTRQSIHIYFGGRAGLLAALRAELERTSPRAVALRQAAGLRPAPQALAAYVVAWMRYMPEAVALADPHAGASPTLRRIVDRLAGEGRLAPGWSAEEASAWIAAQLSPATWRALVMEAGWPPQRVAERMIHSLGATLIAPD